MRWSTPLLLGLLLGGPVAETHAEALAPAVHQQLHIVLDPDERRLRGEARVRVEGLETAAFGLAPGYRVTSLRVNGEPAPLGEDNHWRLLLNGHGADIELAYEGRLPSLAAAQAGEARVFLDADGGFFPRDAGWYPYFDEDTRYTYSLTVDTPSAQRVAALGLVEESEREGRRQTRFASSEPVLGIDLFSGPYRVQTLRRDGVTIRTYFTEALAPELADTYLRASARYLAHYSGLIGRYPYPDFSVIASPLPVGYGFAGATYIGEQVLRLPFIPHTSLPHEILHNWWGNGVYVHYERGNWSEGLTTFLADYGLVEARDPAAAAAQRAAWLRDYAALPEARDVPLRAFVAREDQASQVIGYHKAAMVFYMLRARIGESAFHEGLRHFWQEHRLRHAAWGDLRRAFERASGQDLGAFFAHWVDRAGAPRLTVEVAHRDGRLSVTLGQAVAEGEAPYPLLVPLELRWGDERQRRAVALEGRSRTVSFEAPAAQGTLAVDPDAELFRRLWPEEIPPIVRAVTLAPETRLLVAAADEAAREVARTVAAQLGMRLLPVAAGEAAEAPAEAPLLVVGTRAELDALLADRGWTRPEAVAGAGAARAWMDPEAPARLFVEGDDAQALAALGRVLRHYANESYLVWEEGRVGERGVWPVEDSRLVVRWR
ncbi:M1 family peptidase [Ectothiorhodospiraceae bacterium 2226]|nr:M1 family peptidase [Ectothiorhodospiraceae bacterium 2226]